MKHLVLLIFLAVSAFSAEYVVESVDGFEINGVKYFGTEDEPAVIVYQVSNMNAKSIKEIMELYLQATQGNVTGYIVDESFKNEFKLKKKSQRFMGNMNNRKHLHKSDKDEEMAKKDKEVNSLDEPIGF